MEPTCPSQWQGIEIIKTTSNKKEIKKETASMHLNDHATRTLLMTETLKEKIGFW